MQNKNQRKQKEKTKTEINEIEKRKTIEKINENKC